MSRSVLVSCAAAVVLIAAAALFAPTAAVPQLESRSAWPVPRVGYAASYARLNDPQLRAYMSARQGCAGLPLSQQARCQVEANAKFPTIDADCQKLAGVALSDCLRTRDRES